MSADFKSMNLQQLREAFEAHQAQRPNPESYKPFQAWLAKKDEIRFWLDLAEAKSANTWKDVPCPDRPVPQPKPIEDPMPQPKKYASDEERKEAIRASKRSYSKRKAAAKKAERPAPQASITIPPKTVLVTPAYEPPSAPTLIVFGKATRQADATPKQSAVTPALRDRIHHLRALTWSLLSDLEAVSQSELVELRDEVRMFDAAAQATGQVLVVRGVA